MLTTKEIEKQINLGNITINNLKNISPKKPNSIDVHLGNYLYLFDYQVLDAKMSKDYLQEVISDKPSILRRVQIPEDGFLLEPYKLYLAKTVESVKTNGFIPALNGKVSMSLLGVSVELNSGYKWDKYDGNLILSIVATKPTIIYPDIPIGNLTFFPSLDVTHESQIINGITCGKYKSGMLGYSEIEKRMQGENPDIFIDDTSKIVRNPNSINLTLNETFGVYTEPILDIKYPNPKRYVSIEEGMWLYPNEIYLARTNEWTRTNNLVPMMSGRSSLGRMGIHVHCSAGMGSIGYCGYWHMGIRPTMPVWVEKDLKCCQIYYYTIEGEYDNIYDGTMQDLPKSELSSQMHRILKK